MVIDPLSHLRNFLLKFQISTEFEIRQRQLQLFEWEHTAYSVSSRRTGTGCGGCAQKKVAMDGLDVVWRACARATISIHIVHS